MVILNDLKQVTNSQLDYFIDIYHKRTTTDPQFPKESVPSLEQKVKETAAVSVGREERLVDIQFRLLRRYRNDPGTEGIGIQVILQNHSAHVGF